MANIGHQQARKAGLTLDELAAEAAQTTPGTVAPTAGYMAELARQMRLFS